MAERVFMPQLGESVTEGTISKWLVKAGDFVKKYDPICEVNTDKVNAEVPSSFSGTISEIAVQEGETVTVGTLICCIAVEGAGEEQRTSPSDDSAVDKGPSEASSMGELQKQRYSPAVLKLTQEHQLDLTRIQGTGTGGRITRKDVMAVVEGGGQIIPVQPDRLAPQAEDRAMPASPVQSGATSKETAGIPPAEQGDQLIPTSGVRKTIAQRMVQSKQEAPHAWTMVECDVTNLVRFRNEAKADFKTKEGVNLTFLPFFIKAVVEAIKEFPIMNSQWAGDKIVIKKGIHISIAVATEDALYVPVIKDADQKSIYGIAKSIDELVNKTKAGKLTMQDMAGGTFTCNNTGAFGSVMSAPIINQPQAAILSMESIVKRPVVIQDMIAIRDMVNLCLSLDHRVLDGLVCGRFLQSVKKKMESYGPDTKIY